jgi:hypothetical protein
VSRAYFTDPNPLPLRRDKDTIPPSLLQLRLLHCWLDTWAAIGLISVGLERQGYRLSLSRIAEGEWRAYFMSHPM